jgi:hypothetical protein
MANGTHIHFEGLVRRLYHLTIWRMHGFENVPSITPVTQVHSPVLFPNRMGCIVIRVSGA